MSPWQPLLYKLTTTLFRLIELKSGGKYQLFWDLVTDNKRRCSIEGAAEWEPIYKPGHAKAARLAAVTIDVSSHGTVRLCHTWCHLYYSRAALHLISTLTNSSLLSRHCAGSAINSRRSKNIADTRSRKLMPKLLVTKSLFRFRAQSETQCPYLNHGSQ